MSKKLSTGFTLIEVMVVVAVVGILAALAYSSYMGAVRKSSRGEAKAQLNVVAQQLQRCYTVYARYDDTARCDIYKDLTDADKYTSKGSGFYRITIAPLVAGSDRSTYKLTATAIKHPVTEDAGCQVLTLDHTGVRLPAADCW